MLLCQWNLGSAHTELHTLSETLYEWLGSEFVSMAICSMWRGSYNAINPWKGSVVFVKNIWDMLCIHIAKLIWPKHNSLKVSISGMALMAMWYDHVYLCVCIYTFVSDTMLYEVFNNTNVVSVRENIGGVR